MHQCEGENVKKMSSKDYHDSAHRGDESTPNSTQNNERSNAEHRQMNGLSSSPPPTAAGSGERKPSAKGNEDNIKKDNVRKKNAAKAKRWREKQKHDMAEEKQRIDAALKENEHLREERRQLTGQLEMLNQAIVAAQQRRQERGASGCWGDVRFFFLDCFMQRAP
jgi:hypothetical protein